MSSEDLLLGCLLRSGDAVSIFDVRTARLFDIRILMLLQSMHVRHFEGRGGKKSEERRGEAVPDVLAQLIM